MKAVRLSGILALVVGAACSGGSTDPGTSGNPGGGGGGGGATCPSGSVCLLSGSFQPSSVTVARGGSVAFINDSGILHTVTFDAPRPAGVDDVGLHSSGTNTRTFGTVGRFPFHCTQHAGMTGEINVN